MKNRATGLARSDLLLRCSIASAWQCRIPAQTPDQEILPVKHPWTKKNPLMSMRLSGVNMMASRARGHATTETNRQKALLTRQATRFWTGDWLAAVKTRRNR